VISSEIGITHGFVFELPQRTASSTEELQVALAEAVSDLTNALEKNPDFKSEVEKYMK
jgi:hypothetical protein